MKLFLAFLWFVCLTACQANYEMYYQEIKDFRTKKDERFKNLQETPLLPENLASFKGLNYFAPDYKWKIKAKLEKFTKPEMLAMQSTKGGTLSYWKFGIVKMRYEDQNIELLVFKSTQANAPENILFIPFSDNSSGASTYGAGRYLDVTYNSKHSELMIDFNYAYNPFCAYNPNFDCVFPPKENHIEISVLAGEKNWK